jgi:hypothetical protein
MAHLQAESGKSMQPAAHGCNLQHDHRTIERRNMRKDKANVEMRSRPIEQPGMPAQAPRSG